MFEWIGWIATAVFAASYFFKQPQRLRYIQAFAALLWIGYGIFLQAPPIIVSNLVVAILALSSAWQQRSQATAEAKR
ncbi:MAG TPA: YgjV family protein [Blastocatellia bacterium]|nr:YgjV family protein [Blastocatellia bacterium]